MWLSTQNTCFYRAAQHTCGFMGLSDKGGCKVIGAMSCYLNGAFLWEWQAISSWGLIDLMITCIRNVEQRPCSGKMGKQCIYKAGFLGTRLPEFKLELTWFLAVWHSNSDPQFYTYKYRKYTTVYKFVFLYKYIKYNILHIFKHIYLYDILSIYI